MFDGNHRTRRNINLSSSTKRRTVHRSVASSLSSNSSNIGSTRSANLNSRSSILEEAKRSREKRFEIQRQNKAATHIQRLWRGYTSRMTLASDLLSIVIIIENNDNEIDKGVTKHNSIRLEHQHSLWSAISGLLSPTLVNYILPAYFRMQQRCRSRSSRHDDKTSIGSSDSSCYRYFLTYKYNSFDKTIVFIAQQLLSILQHTLFVSSKESRMKFSIVSCQRVVLHCLFFLDMFNDSATAVDTADEIEHLATSILSFLTIFLSQNDNNNMVHLINHMDVLHILTTCGQKYYQTLNDIHFPNNTSQHTKTKNIQLIYSITRELIVFICRSIISSTRSHNLTYLSLILLGIDLQKCLDYIYDDNVNIKEDQTTYSPFSIVYECANLYLSENNSMVVDDESIDENRIKQQFVLILFKSLDRATSYQHTNKTTTSSQQIPSTQQQSYIVSLLMSGHELVYISNALIILNILKTKTRNKQQPSIHDKENDCDCIVTISCNLIQLLTHVLGIDNYDKDIVLENDKNGQLGNFQPLLFSNKNITSNKAYMANTLIGLIAKGEPIATFLNISNANHTNIEININDTMIDNSEDILNDEDDDLGNKDDSFVTSSKILPNLVNNRRSHLKRQDLQTISKLDQLYQSNISQSREELWKYLKVISKADCTRLIEVSSVIGSGDQMLEWALLLFPTEKTVIRGNIKHLDSIRDIFIAVLSMNLSFCSGIKPRTCAMSPLLSKLAFQSKWMEAFWYYTKMKMYGLEDETVDPLLYSQNSINAFSTISLFCDLFAHSLLALDDEEFLSLYTSQNMNGRNKSSICVLEVIEMLRSNLYKLYWSRPVRAEEVMIPSRTLHRSQEDKELNQRARFFLSGTKLWNSLYQRWSRLLTTTKFCDDKCWHFPRLVSKGNDEEGAVFGTNDMQDMNVDDDDNNSTSSMDIDDTIRIGATIIDEENDTLASAFKDPKMARILTSIPQAIPFERRVKLFNSLLSADLSRMQDETQAARSMMLSMLNGEEGAEFQGRIQAKIHRDRLYEDSIKQLNGLGPKLRKKIAVTFTNQVGAVEAGIDGGGVFREFLDDLIKDGFHPEKKHGHMGPLFTVSPLQTLSVNTNLEPTQEILNNFEFLGRVL